MEVIGLSSSNSDARIGRNRWNAGIRIVLGTGSIMLLTVGIWATAKWAGSESCTPLQDVSGRQENVRLSRRMSHACIGLDNPVNAWRELLPVRKKEEQTSRIRKTLIGKPTEEVFKRLAIKRNANNLYDAGICYEESTTGLKRSWMERTGNDAVKFLEEETKSLEKTSDLDEDNEISWEEGSKIIRTAKYVEIALPGRGCLWYITPVEYILAKLEIFRGMERDKLLVKNIKLSWELRTQINFGFKENMRLDEFLKKVYWRGIEWFQKKNGGVGNIIKFLAEEGGNKIDLNSFVRVPIRQSYVPKVYEVKIEAEMYEEPK